ncbi:hypothetical protein FJV41_20860 [Myxococcus llanfairpwllgwyngyllgogerychwyrndrobwllllantysiliogogogochensis]|uniref:F5/8 type C domain-containing protein n=1 Tax=Myxococcus llanfairpwllgwyngyllgogerychwyrndrobwllllantysiliogogogochensis TaxID=2590453 RepID=A0A540WYG5_9BACT|nr:hypothetical protein [Myxococcus llanfairpwllgwyngyllgogerychwyrndrobwllllantysiliogogogochensis]TQF14052.1 hypothetical protein FJV41_20860 [Myxococcus llanfairpwllgwyngyllgogerychwyrndrobwllllantysiliogogogochensis]
MHPTRNNVGAYIHAANLSHAPAAQAAGSRNGAVFTFGTFRSLVLCAVTGATAGTPTSFSATYKLQTSADGTTWADAKDRDGDTVALAVAAAGSVAELDVDLQEVCPDGHDRIRVVETVAFTGGTAPTVLSSSTVIFGGGQTLPV